MGSATAAGKSDRKAREALMPEEIIRVLIWGKTYPELSARYVETVCTAGVREDGRPIRLYPVPLRYLDTRKQFALYDWVEAPIVKSTADPRPESFKVVSGKIRIVGHLDTKKNWKARSAIVFKDPGWQFDCYDALVREESKSKRSMGVVTPGNIDGVDLVKKSAGAEKEYRKKLDEVQGQQDLFHPQYKELEFLPYHIRLRWRCASTKCSCQSGRAHDHMVLDWGLLELARRSSWVKARQKLQEISNLKEKDFRLFIGNFRLHPKAFGIVGLWYPKLQRSTAEQPTLF